MQITHLKRTQLLFVSALVLALAGCGGREVPAAGTTPAASTPVVTPPVVATTTSLTLSASANTLKSDGSDSITITATALDAGNSVLTGQAVTFSASTGQLSASTGTTDATGIAKASFSAGASGINRTATVTVTSGAATMQLPIQITGSTISANPSTGTSLPDDGTTPATIVFTAKNPAGVAVAGTTVTLAKSGVGNISYSPTSGSTDANGQFSVVVSGVVGGAGAAMLSATALGTTGTASFTVTPVTSTFSISGLSLNATALTAATTNNFSNTSMQIGDSLLVTVTVPAPTTQVTFVSTTGFWNNVANQTSLQVPVAAGTASATLNTTQAGLASVQVLATTPASTISDTLSVSMTAITPATITLQASPSVIPKSAGTSSGTSTLIATVNDATGQPVGGAPVFFSILNPTGGGETVSPAVAYTTTTTGNGLNLGQAKVTLTAGSLSSTANGVQVRAQALGTSVVTEAAGLNATASGNDAAVVIGGTAASMAFGQATVLGVNSNATAYVLPMSITVADGNGNPAPMGTVVSLSLWPIAWSTGIACQKDPDGFVPTITSINPFTVTYAVGNGGTFFNEDINENLILDGIEDGTRTYYATGGAAPGVGTIDAAITPSNSMAGTVPATVTTDATGLAVFDLTYPKSSAIWT
ncbi:MAG: Ig-like domain-containing protein, partial [Sideroxydans sp.]